jgi:TldD protein
MYFDKVQYRKYAQLFLESIKAQKVDFCEIRFQENLIEDISFKNLNIENIYNIDRRGVSIRVLYNGNWGFSASSDISQKTIEDIFNEAFGMVEYLSEGTVKITSEEVYQDEDIQEVLINPFEVPISEKIEYISSIQNDILKEKNIDFADASLIQVYEKKLYLNSSGSDIYQERCRLFPSFMMYRVNPELTTLKFYTRPVSEGYEYFKNFPFKEEILRANENIYQKSKAKEVISGKYNLLIDPSNLWLTIHESIGHSTEMDRVLLYEANYAGSSFASVDGIGELVYGSEKVNIVGDRTQKNGLASVKYDDEGVKTSKFDIIKNGVLEDLQTNREIAAFSGRENSNGCSFANSYSSFPLQRMPNVSLLPNQTKDLGFKDMLNIMGDGIYIKGDGSWSIDMQRYNFQFTGDLFYEVKAGKIVGMVKDLSYQSNTQDFWKSCVEVGGQSTYSLEGAFNCGKGQPSQVAPVSHGAPISLFKDIKVLNTKNEN